MIETFMQITVGIGILLLGVGTLALGIAASYDAYKSWQDNEDEDETPAS